MILINGFCGVHDFFLIFLNKILQAIGAEYGEGFESFRPSGLLKVDVVSIHLHD